ncbi:MAG: hypothetical protein LAO78_23445 [Acidobacteriia bacterium]|nr:hypothetical protein [Terriglobia bacterium]
MFYSFVMTEQNYQKALENARQELERLLREQSERAVRIATLKQTIAALAALCGEPQDNSDLYPTVEPTMSAGLTDAIRAVMEKTITPLGATQIRDGLAAQGFDLSEYANELAVIHNTLNRLQRQGEVVKMGNWWRLTTEGRLIAKAIASGTMRGMPPPPKTAKK